MKRSPLSRKTPLARKPPAKSRRKNGTGPSAEVVELVYERANHSCEICCCALGDRRGVDHHIHHRRPRAAGGTKRDDANLPSNLLLLCPDCHHDVESHRLLSLQMGWLVPQTLDPALVVVLVQRDRWVLLTADGVYRDMPPEATS